MRSHGFNPEHPAAVGESLRRIIFDELRPQTQRASDILEFSSRHQAKSLPPQNLGQIFLSLGNLSEWEPRVRTLIEREPYAGELNRLMIIARRQIDSFDQQNIAETLRGLVLLGEGRTTLSEALMARGRGMVEQFEPVDIVTVLGAIRMLRPEKHSARGDEQPGMTEEGVFDRTKKEFEVAVVEAAVQRYREFNDLETVLGALYLADLGKGREAGELIDRAMRRLDDLEIRHVGMLGAAMRKLPSLPDGYCFAVADEVTRRIISEPGSMSTRESVQVLALLGERRMRHDRFIEAFCDEFRERVGSFSVDELRDTARSLAMLHEGDRDFFARIGFRARTELAELEPSDMSFIAWSFASLGIREDALFAGIAHHMRSRFDELSASAAANIAWSFAPLDNELARRVIASAGEVVRRRPHKVEDLGQLHIAEVAVGITPPGRCPEEVIELARGQIEPMNQFEVSVFEAIEALHIPGVEVRSFEIVEGLIPDFTITHGARRVVLECDGARYHLTSQGEPRGRDLIQDQVFHRAGYEVVHILDLDWRALSLEERKSHLHEALGFDRYQ